MTRMNLEAERARHGITKTNLAQRIGVSLNTYSSYVNGAPMPSTKLCLLADIFHVSTDYLLGRSMPSHMSGIRSEYQSVDSDST